MVYKYWQGMIMNFLLLVAVIANTVTPFSIKIVNSYNPTLSVNIMILFFSLIIILILVRWYFDKKYKCSI
jgi:hypothetical protein